MVRKLTTAVLALALGAGAALGVTACGEQRGDVKFEGGASTSGTSTSGTAATSTAGTVETEVPKTTTTSP